MGRVLSVDCVRDAAGFGIVHLVSNQAVAGTTLLGHCLSAVNAS